MDKGIQSYARIYSGNWKHGGLLASRPRVDSASANYPVNSEKKKKLGTRSELFLAQSLQTSLSVILDERMFYVGPEVEGMIIVCNCYT